MGRKDERRYQMICGFSNNKRKRTAWNNRKDNTITLDTQVNVAESDTGSFYNHKEWFEEYMSNA